MSTLAVRAFAGTARAEGGTIVSMRPMDMPPHRPLGGWADAPDDAGGRARPPSELLDELRERLQRLPDCHPSAPREPGRSPRGQDSQRGQAEGPDGQAEGPDGQAEGRDRQGRRLEGQAERLDEQAMRSAEDALDADGASDGDRVPDADGVPDSESVQGADRAQDGEDPPDGADDADDADAPRRGRLAGSGERSDLAGLDLGKLLLPEDYRPWFMSSDQATPWFAVDEGM